MSRKAFLPLAFLAAVTACSPSATNGVTKGQEVHSGPFGMITADSVKVDTSAAFKGLQKVTVGSYTIGFATYKTASAKVMKGSSSGHNTLLGIDDATMQKITDESYKNFVADLKAKGYTVVDRSELMANKDFNSTKTYPNPYEDSTSGFFGEASKLKYFAPSSFNGVKIFMGDIVGTMGGFATDSPTVGAAKYFDVSGVKVIHAIYVLDFANNDTSGGLSRWSTQVKIGQGMTVIPTASKLSVSADQGGLMATGNGSITIGQPISSDKEFATVSDKTSDTHMVAEGAANVIATLGGIGGSQSRDFEFQARPKDFKAAASDAIEQANTVLVGKMSELK